jgi:hypothetical protein
MRLVRLLVLLAAAAAAAVVANVALLGVAAPARDPVGQLSPRAQLVTVPRRPLTPRPPALPRDDQSERGADD